MVLSDEQIKSAVKEGGIKIVPFDENQIEAASYNFRVGPEAVTTSSKEKRILAEKGFIIFQPGDFGFITTLETIQLSDEYTGRFGLRSKFARKGLAATTGPQIDPGYYGRLIIGITNLTPNPVTLSYEEDFITVEFHKLPKPAKHPYNGPFQGVTSLRPEDIELVTEKKGMVLTEMQQTLSSLSQNVGALTRDINTLKWVLGIGLAILGLIVGLASL